MKIRDIKFRAWKVFNETSEMVYSDTPKQNYKVTPFGIFANDKHNYQYTSYTLFGEEYPIMQYTGMKDKNGIDIYEGDIVKVDNYTMYPNKTKVIQWDNELSSYVFKSDKVTAVRLPMALGITVIGNIYENK